MQRRAKPGFFFYLPEGSLISVQVIGNGAFTSLVVILKSAALDASLRGWMVDCTCIRLPPSLVDHLWGISTQ